MKLNIVTAIGFFFQDPRLPGKMYLSKTGGLTRNTTKAILVKEDELEEALEKAKEISLHIFTKEVVA